MAHCLNSERSSRFPADWQKLAETLKLGSRKVFDPFADGMLLDVVLFKV